MSKIPQHITEAIEKYRTEGPVALASILEMEHNPDLWEEMDVDEEIARLRQLDEEDARLQSKP